MFPDLQIFLERCDSESDVVLFDLRKVATPLQEGGVLVLLDLFFGHLLRPLGSPRDLQGTILRLLPFGLDELVYHAHHVLVDDGAAGLMEVTLLDRVEFLLRELSKVDELLQAILFEHGCQLGLGLLAAEVGSMLQRDVRRWLTYNFVPGVIGDLEFGSLPVL